MNESIKAEIQPIKKILCNEDKFYQVPNYQRPYSWNKEQLSVLIDDLVGAYEIDQEHEINQAHEEYFCGSLVLVHNKKDDRYDIIDGQQRITTFIIMACVFKTDYFEQLKDRQKERVEASIRDKFGEKGVKLKFLTDSKFQNDFENKVLNKISDEQDKKNRYLENAKLLQTYIKKAIKEKNIDINKFVEWFYETVKLTEIICYTEDRAIQIFNVLNDRGLQLSPVDILKSRLMIKLDDEAKNAFHEDWKTIKSRLEDKDMEFLNMLTAYQFYVNPQTKQQRLDKTLLEKLKDELKKPNGALKVINKIKDFSEKYIECLAARDKYIYCLRYLESNRWAAVLAAAKFVKYQDYEELKKLLVAYYYQTWIATGTEARVKVTSFAIIRAIKEQKPIAEIQQMLKDNLASYPSYTEFIKIESNWAKPILLLVEYFLTDDSKNGFITNDKQLNIEHILPQTPIEDWSKCFTDDEKKEWTHSLANLSLLSKRKNIQARNYDFDRKKKAYKETDNVTSSFVMIQKICEYKNWNVDALKNREIFLLDRIKEKLDLFNE